MNKSWEDVFNLGTLVTDPEKYEFTPFFSTVPEPQTKIELENRGTYDPRNTLNNLTGKEWVKFNRSWFVHKPPPRDSETNLHPAKFPETMIEDFVQFFTKRGQWVLDPFAGTGSTIVACGHAKRNAIGVELTRKWAKISARRGKGYTILADARDIPKMNLPVIDFCISSPPYWDMLWHSRGGSSSTQKKRLANGHTPTFSNDTRDVGNLRNYEDFKRTLLDIYAGILSKTKSGGYCVVFLQNILKENQEFYPLAWEFALGMRGVGWQLCQEKIWCQRDKKLGIWGFPTSYIASYHHHYALVFRAKPL